MGKPTRTATQNAEEFGALTKQGKDVRLALLVACSVEKGTRGGDRAKNDRSLPKLDAAAFAAVAGTSGPRVLRHLTAWNKFAKLTGLPVAADLVPTDALRLDITEDQALIFEDEVSLDSKNGGNVSQKEKDIAGNTKAMAGAIRNNPKVRQAAAAALQGTVEATEIAAQVMLDPKNVEVVIGNRDVYESVVKGQAQHLINKRRATTTTERPPRPVTSTTMSALTLMLLLDEFRGKIEQLAHFVESRELDSEEKDIVRTFITEEALLVLSGLLDHPGLTGEEITPEAFGA